MNDAQREALRRLAASGWAERVHPGTARVLARLYGRGPDGKGQPYVEPTEDGRWRITHAGREGLAHHDHMRAAIAQDQRLWRERPEAQKLVSRALALWDALLQDHDDYRISARVTRHLAAQALGEPAVGEPIPGGWEEWAAEQARSALLILKDYDQTAAEAARTGAPSITVVFDAPAPAHLRAERRRERLAAAEAPDGTVSLSAFRGDR